MPDAAAESPAPRWPLFAALALVLAAAALRLAPSTESLWLDELHTAWSAAGSLAEVSSRAAIGNQSPLFFWLEWCLARLLGPTELALRLPSLIAGSLLPLAVFLVARRWSSSDVGLLAAALVTLDPMAIFYATEARPYALIQLLAVLHVALTAEILVQPTTWLRATWVALAAILFHLHYTSALLFPAEIAFYALAAWLRPNEVHYRITSIMLDALALAVLCLPAIANVGSIFGRRANWEAFIDQQPLWKIFDWWPYALGAWYLAAALVLNRFAIANPAATNSVTQHNGHVALLLLCWLFVPALLAWIAAATGVARLFFPRYLLATAPAAILIAASCANLAPWRWSKIAVGSLILAVGLWSSGIVESIRNGRPLVARGEDWRGCVAWLNDQLPQSQFPVLVFSGLIESDALRQPHDPLLEDYCLLPVTSLYPLDIDRADLAPLPLHDPGRLNQVAEMLAVHRGGAWLIVHGNKETALRIAAAVVGGLDRSALPGQKRGWRVGEVFSFGHVQALPLTAEMTLDGEENR